MPYWLSHGRPPRPAASSSETLTQAQFNDLPEIVYEPVPGDDDVVVLPEGEDDNKRSDILPDMETDLEMGVNDTPQTIGNATATSESEQSTSPVSSSALAADGAQPDPNGLSNHLAQPTISILKTICTECSICIDDFEAGERLTILPRCRHAFHRDCIKPWLLERQGCCPLCKLSVLQDDNAETSTSTEQGTENSSANQGAVVPAAAP